MLSSCARPLSRVLGSVATKPAPKSSFSLSRSSKSPNSSSLISSTHSRFYAGHAHHEEAPKPYKRTILAPLSADAAKNAEEVEREVKGIEGWIFGRKVTYLDPLKPIEDSEAVKQANGWLFNKKPGQPFVWEEWEPITYTTTVLAIILVLVGLWTRPDHLVQHWALDEAQERKALRARRELALKQQESL